MKDATMLIPTYDDMLAAHDRIRPHIRQTPVRTSDYLNEVSGAELFLNLMEAVIDRASDILSVNTAKVDAVSNHVFTRKKTVGFDHLITRLGRAHV